MTADKLTLTFDENDSLSSYKEKDSFKVRQGQIYYVDFADEDNETDSIQKGMRPVIIVSSDFFNRKSSVCIVAKITSKIKRLDLPTHVLLPELKGLPKRSMVVAEQQRTVGKARLLEYRGEVDDKVYAQVDRAVKAATRRRRVSKKGK